MTFFKEIIGQKSVGLLFHVNVVLAIPGTLSHAPPVDACCAVSYGQHLVASIFQKESLPLD